MKFFAFRGRSDPPASAQPTTTERDSLQDIAVAARELDLDVAIMAHENWKARLSSYIAGRSNEDFSPERICLDNQCDLGLWLYSDSTKNLQQSVADQYLLAQHKMFHYTASSIVALCQSADSAKADGLLRTKFTRYSSNVKRTLGDMKLLARLGRTA